MPILRILIVDDHDLVRLGLKALLSHHPQFTVVAEARGAREAVEAVERHRPDVVVMDIRLPGKSGIEATREIVERYPATKVIMLTSYADDELLFHAITAGASGYVLKQIGGAELVHALEAIGRGESLLSPELMQSVWQRVRESLREEEEESFAGMTPQELCILDLVVAGKTNKAIAAATFLSEHTVRNYVSSILNKLHLENRAAAAAYAVKHHVHDHLPSL